MKLSGVNVRGQYIMETKSYTTSFAEGGLHFRFLFYYCGIPPLPIGFIYLRKNWREVWAKSVTDKPCLEKLKSLWESVSILIILDLLKDRASSYESEIFLMKILRVTESISLVIFSSFWPCRPHKTFEGWKNWKRTPCKAGGG